MTSKTSTDRSSIRCETYLPGGWCRNKVVIQAPNGAGGMKNLCKRHADQYAHEIVMKNHALYWALAWQGNLNGA